MTAQRKLRSSQLLVSLVNCPLRCSIFDNPDAGQSPVQSPYPTKLDIPTSSYTPQPSCLPAQRQNVSQQAAGSNNSTTEPPPAQRSGGSANNDRQLAQVASGSAPGSGKRTRTISETGSEAGRYPARCEQSTGVIMSIPRPSSTAVQARQRHAPSRRQGPEVTSLNEE